MPVCDWLRSLIEQAEIENRPLKCLRISSQDYDALQEELKPMLLKPVATSFAVLKVLHEKYMPDLMSSDQRHCSYFGVEIRACCHLKPGEYQTPARVGDHILGYL